MQFFRSCFRERGSPNGEDFYPQTRRFPAAILGGLQGEATQYTDKKTAQAVCNAYENGFSGRNEMKEKGWRPFWAALLAALLVLLPLVGGTVLLTRRSLRTRLASRPQSGVAIRQPKEENRLSLLVCIAPTETTAPGFLLLYLNASQNCIHALALPGELTVPFGADETALSDCYRAAGPARCREALLSALSLPEDTHYLALAPSVLQAIADRYGMLRVGFSGALTAEELVVTGCSSNVQAISAREAEELLNGMEDTVPPAHKAAARAAVWDAFFRQELELLPAALPDALRALFRDGEEFGRIQAEVERLQLQDFLLLKGRADDLDQRYGQYALFVLTSYREGMPLVLLEAKQHRVPMVSFDCVTGPQEIITDGGDGFLIPPGDIEKMADAICILIERPELRAEMGAFQGGKIESFRKPAVLAQWIRQIEGPQGIV